MPRIDVSKATLDVVFCHKESPDQFAHQQFANTTAGFRQLLAWFKKQKVDVGHSFFCMEHTGHYTLALCCFLQEQGLTYTLVSPLHLKKSLGITRGKSDRVDAQRIARFACLQQRTLKSMQLPSACLLKNLITFRNRLTKTKVSPLANRKMKVLLSNCASAALQHDSELKAYYQRKIKQGKAKMAVFNAVAGARSKSNLSMACLLRCIEELNT